MRHRLQWFIHLRAHRKGDEHPTYTLLMGYGTLYLYRLVLRLKLLGLQFGLLLCELRLEG